MFHRPLEAVDMDFRPNPRHTREVANIVYGQFERIAQSLTELGAELAEDLSYQADEMERALRLIGHGRQDPVGVDDELAELRRRLSRLEERFPGPREL